MYYSTCNSDTTLKNKNACQLIQQITECVQQMRKSNEDYVMLVSFCLWENKEISKKKKGWGKTTEKNSWK